MEVVQKISETPVDDKGVAVEQVEVRHISIRDTHLHNRKLFRQRPFSSCPLIERCWRRASITIELFPDKAPMRAPVPPAGAGQRVDGMAFHRVAPGFVIQTGALASRAAPLTEKQQRLVRNLQPEFNDTKHIKGIVSMARGDDPASATTSFFICTGASSALDGQYLAFGRVIDGITVVEAVD